MGKTSVKKQAPAGSKREDIVRLAYGAFDAQGVYGTGIDKVLAKSGISKRTVYKYFDSKEDLIAAAIAHYQHVTFAAIVAALEKRARGPKEKLLTLFDMKQEELAAGDYGGCFAINAGLAYHGKDARIEKAFLTFLTELEKFIATLCREAGCRRPDMVAMQVTVLFQGTILYGQSRRNPAAALAAREIVKALLK